MKTLFKLFILGVLSVFLTIAATAGEPTGKWEPAGSKNKNLMVFKADKKMIGAKVEIFQQDGAIIAEQILRKKKLLIDFATLKEGSYTVRITKGEMHQEFKFDKK